VYISVYVFIHIYIYIYVYKFLGEEEEEDDAVVASVFRRGLDPSLVLEGILFFTCTVFRLTYRWDVLLYRYLFIICMVIFSLLMPYWL
jgi:hypothetical protein